MAAVFMCGCDGDKGVRTLPDAPGLDDGGVADATVDAPDDAPDDATIDANPNCGNGVVDTGEDCDGSAPTTTSCVKQGYATGSVGCTASCTFELSACTAANPTLMVWYRFEEAANATAAVDSSGHNVTGTVVGATTMGATGIVGLSAQFDGTTGYIDSGTPAVVTNLASVTTEAWVNLDAQTQFGASVVAKVADNNNVDFGMLVTTTSPQWISAATDVTYGYHSMQAPAGPAANGTWVHLAGVYEVSTNTRRVYVNGVEITTFSTFGANIAAPMNETGPLHVGNCIWNATQNISFLDGRVDEVKIWASVRTQAQICSDAGGIPAGAGACSMTPILP